jgi:hypothetical protein
LANVPSAFFGTSFLKSCFGKHAAALWALGIGRRRRTSLGPSLAEIVGAGK